MASTINFFLGYGYLTMGNTEVPGASIKRWYVCFIKLAQKLEIQVSYSVWYSKADLLIKHQIHFHRIIFVASLFC